MKLSDIISYISYIQPNMQKLHDLSFTQKFLLIIGLVFLVWFLISIFIVAAGSDGSGSILSLVLSTLAMLGYTGYGGYQAFKKGQCPCGFCQP